MLIKISPHLKQLAKESPAIRKQFYATDLEAKDVTQLPDLLLEEAHTKVKGLVHKYDNRVLILLTLQCASYCRFCTRRRTVSQVASGVITKQDLFNMKTYILQNSQIKEIILSGGDPFTVVPLLKEALTIFSRIPQIKWEPEFRYQIQKELIASSYKL